MGKGEDGEKGRERGRKRVELGEKGRERGRKRVELVVCGYVSMCVGG